jgi:selenobiotic family peptide radical SAM maturase
VTDHETDNRYRLAPSLKVRAERRRIALSWQDPLTGRELSEIAGPDELLGLKIVSENLSVRELSRQHKMPVSRYYRLLSYLDRKGILQAPPRLLRRDPEIFGSGLADDRTTVTVFWLQWHLTNACDLHCRHCYDRSQRSNMTSEQAARVLDELERFCRRHWVAGNISFTGGNPFLYRGFLDLYREAVRRGFEVDILGNPVPREQIEALCRIQPPSGYQVSLEGRRSHNDSIRGAGSYDRAIKFLGLLRELGIPSGVMLTVTESNLKEVLPLARLLEGKTDGFAFTRLAPVGEGAALRQPDPARFRSFLKRYVRHAARNSTVAFKENLISLTLAECGEPLSEGCTGFGCGAAFNCLPVLPDGEVHACRRFPSLLGNIQEQSLEELYFSPAAVRYRRGMSACDGCSIRHACGGCMGAASPARDQFCWRPALTSQSATT